MFSVTKQIKILLLTSTLISFVIIFVHKKKVFLQVPITTPLAKVKPYIQKWTQDSNISCYYETEEDVLPSAEDASFSPQADTIFFHETSCRGGLNSRQACAVEAAARAHPERDVYVLFSGPVSERLLTQSCLATLSHLANIHFARVHIDEYTKGTALEEFVALRTYYRSKWPVEHTSDILRFVSLYKWGGIYLDTDIVVIKPLNDLGKNWAARQDEYSVNVAALAIGKDETGRQIVDRLMNELQMNFMPNEWHHNGPGTISRVLKVFCNTSNVINFSANRCRGFQVYIPEFFYPIPFSNFEAFFEKWRPDDIYDFDDAHAVHFWNRVTYNRSFEKDSLLDNLVSKYCPMIYQKYRDVLTKAQIRYSKV